MHSAHVRRGPTCASSGAVQIPCGSDQELLHLIRCEEADYVVNFLSVGYVKSQACADEWCYGKNKKRPEQLVNLVVGGREYCYRLMRAGQGVNERCALCSVLDLPGETRNAIQNMPAVELADGASQIQVPRANMRDSHSRPVDLTGGAIQMHLARGGNVMSLPGPPLAAFPTS